MTSFAPSFQLIACGQAERCDGSANPDPQREAALDALLQEARERMAHAELWPSSTSPLLVVMDAPLPPHVVALTISDAAQSGFIAYAGKQALLLSNQDAEQDMDILLHELAHVWLRSRDPTRPEPRWQLNDGRASHESALLHEALADFVAASLTGDPLIGEHALAPAPPRSVTSQRTCPDGLTGAAHGDSVLISNPLWELSGKGQDALASSQILKALSGLPPGSTTSIQHFAGTFSTTLDSIAPALSEKWRKLAEKNQLHQCNESLALSRTAKIAYENDFLAPGLTHFTGQQPPLSPVSFHAELQGQKSLIVSLRSSERTPALLLHWKALGTHQDVLAQGTSQLKGWPSQFLRLSVPDGSQALTIDVINQSHHDVTFNNISLHLGGAVAGAPHTEARHSEFAAWCWLLPAAVVALLALFTCIFRKRQQQRRSKRCTP